MEYKDNIIKTGKAKVEDILFNPDNWREHPYSQEMALKGVLEDVGWVKPIIINSRTGQMIDGHLRVQLAARENQETVPAVWVDLSPEQEKLIVATLDPLGSMANEDSQKLSELINSIETNNVRVKQLLESMNTEKDSEKTHDIPEMELAAFEGYDYIVLVFKNQLDWLAAIDMFHLKKMKVTLSDVEKIGLGRVIDGAEVLMKLRQK